MLQSLSLNEFLELGKTARRVAVYREISADRLTPMSVAENLLTELQDGVILESGLHHPEAGRRSFITFGAMAELKVQQQTVSQRIGTKTTLCTEPPLAALRRLTTHLLCASPANSLDFMNGAVGLLAYDAVRLFENIPDRHHPDHSLPDMLFQFYQTTIMFDHPQHKATVSMIVEIGENPEQTYQQAQQALNELIHKITLTRTAGDSASTQTHLDKTAEVDISDDQFIELIAKAKHYIAAGDAFQIVLSRCFTKPYTVAPFNIYRALRSINPSPYMFYFPVNNSIIIGASPEKLISVKNKIVEINPIAGTRPRRPEYQDEQIAAELLNDKKELAEHTMLVDLARNDIGSVCKPGSVKVRESLKVKHFSHVSHITSTVTGELRQDQDAFDALAAAFPAGTLSGAPKIRAMQIIDELETSRRKLYGGAICRLDYQGNLDSCIAIRMAVLTAGLAKVRTGAGIVHDSNPQAEANETRQKAQAVLDAIALAQRGELG